MEKKYVRVYSAANEIEADLIKSLLDDNGIEASVDPVNMSIALDGIIALGEGFWGYVLVHENQADAAKDLIEEYKNSEEELL